MSSDIPLQVAETIQTAHINRAPSPRHDINPPTAASDKQPVQLEEKRVRISHVHDGEIDVDEAEEEDEDGIPVNVLRPVPRQQRPHLPPMPDLRFEQSVLHSLAHADTWWKVVWVISRDQIMMPLAQGVLYNLAICGWQTWNRNAQLHGSSIGARVRRWWWGVNNWALPAEKPTMYQAAPAFKPGFRRF
ncbi:DUF1770-domain-containing protein [Thozetella sp. PMI_491]|nr:DUF1770-domain-containing protein [Thozetella sp. PMI_491]